MVQRRRACRRSSSSRPALGARWRRSVFEHARLCLQLHMPARLRLCPRPQLHLRCWWQLRLYMRLQQRPHAQRHLQMCLHLHMRMRLRLHLRQQQRQRLHVQCHRNLRLHRRARLQLKVQRGSCICICIFITRCTHLQPWLRRMRLARHCKLFMRMPQCGKCGVANAGVREIRLPRQAHAQSVF